MELKKTRTGDQLIVEFCGRLDTYSTPDAEEEIQGILGGVKHLELDFKETTVQVQVDNWEKEELNFEM